MSNAFFKVPPAKNEPILGYKPGSPEKTELKKTIKKMMGKRKICPCTSVERKSALKKL
jgi:1-pyrroline-5-carboxylate dehydrogenase